MKRAIASSLCVLALLASPFGCSGKRARHAASADTAKPAGVLTTKQPGEFKKPGVNPFAGAKWYNSDQYSNAVVQARALLKTKPDEAALIAKIAKYGGADWVGSWTAYVGDWVRRRTNMIEKEGALPIYIAYNVPNRDCGQYSSGGATKGEEYKKWIYDFAAGIGDRKAVVILEPDALPQLKQCLSEEAQKERLALLNYAVETFLKLPATYVYLDAGHSMWLPAEEAAERLKLAGIDKADGFALNTSNYRATDELMAYGKKVSALVGGKHFVIDTSRNGNGPSDITGAGESWCNPEGRALGSPPTAQTGEPLCDAFLWLKKPGESDGECGGGPKAGEWFHARALEMAKNAKF